jgi:hypothetical protein
MSHQKDGYWIVIPIQYQFFIFSVAISQAVEKNPQPLGMQRGFDLQKLSFHLDSRLGQRTVSLWPADVGLWVEHFLSERLILICG